MSSESEMRAVMEVVSLRMSQPEIDEVDRVAAALHATRSEVIRLAISDFVAKEPQQDMTSAL